MSSSSSHSKGLNRKSLKKSDYFTKLSQSFFDQLASQWGRALIGIGVLLVIGLSFSFWMNQREEKDQASRSALYTAEKAMETELKALTPPKNAPKTVQKNAQKAEDLAAVLGGGDEALDYKKMDIDAKFPHSVQLFKEVIAKFGSTRAGLDASLKLAGLYFNHGEYAKALTWYEKAAQSTSGFEQAVAYSSLGYTHENLGHYLEAVGAFQKALNLGEGSLKGDLLLGIARNYEAAHDTQKARSTYDQIFKDLPNSEYARSAEIYKDLLK